MALAPHDYHLHSDFSPDCSVPMRAMCQAAIARGLPEIGFSEHCDYHPKAPWAGQLDLKGWSEEIERCRDEFGETLRVLRGVEFGEPHLFGDQLREVSQTWDFDYVLGSLHWIGDYTIFNPAYFDRGYKRAFGDYFDELEVMTRNAAFDILSHFDAIARQGLLRFPEYDPAHFEGVIKQTLRNCVDSDTALDLNTAAMRQPVHAFTPNERILRWFKELGGKKVTLGADAHHAQDVGAHFPEALALLRKTGFTSVQNFHKRRARDVAI